MSEPASAAKRSTIALTPGSRVTVRSAGTETEALVSTGTYRGLVSIGGDNALTIELDGSGGEEQGRVRLIPIPAILALDILQAVKPDEEKRAEPPQSPGYFR